MTMIAESPNKADPSPRLEVIKNPSSLSLPNRYGPWTWSTDSGTQAGAEHPLILGHWRSDDFRDTSKVPEAAELHIAEHDGVKFLTKGTLEVLDVTTGEIVTAHAGDALFIPKGSQSRILSSSDVHAFYVDQREREDWELKGPAPTAQASLCSWQAELTASFVAANPLSKRTHEEACEVMPGGNTRSVLHNVPFPLAFDGGHGVKLMSVDGREYTDFVSEYSAAMFGHSHPVIKAAISKAASGGFNLGGPGKCEVALAKHICKRFKSMELVRFCNSGTEANTMCLTAALAHTGRSKILVFDGGYHGGTLSFHTRSSPVNLPHDFVFGAYNDIETTRPLITEDLAAILVEPMQGAGGAIPAQKEFLAFLREAASSVGAVLIFDEVMTSRLAIGGLQAHFDVFPDMTTVGKYLGGGFSFGCFGGRKEIMDRFNPNKPLSLPHSGTFNNNTFSMQAGLAGAELLTEASIEKANALGNEIRRQLQRAIADRGLEHVFSVTGFGSMVGVHFAGPHKDAVRDALFLHLVQRGIYIGRRGFIALNICHEMEHVEELLGATEGFLATLGRMSI